MSTFLISFLITWSVFGIINMSILMLMTDPPKDESTKLLISILNGPIWWIVCMLVSITVFIDEIVNR